MLAVEKSSPSPVGNGRRNASTRRQAALTASAGSSRSRMTTMNSSPPVRPTRSPPRIAPVRRFAAACRRASPTAWPRESLTFLKRSRSTIRTAVDRAVRWPALRARVDLVEQRHPVGQPGQRVVRGEFQERLLGQDPLGDVPVGGDHVSDRAVRGELRRQARLVPAVALGVVDLVLHRRRFARCRTPRGFGSSRSPPPPGGSPAPPSSGRSTPRPASPTARPRDG